MKFVFAKNFINEKNINVAFQNITPLKHGKYRLSVAALNSYRIFLNDKFLHYGPSRSAHGHVQKDSLDISLDREENYITIEVIGNNINSYYYADENPCFAIELTNADNNIIDTDEFECFYLTDRIKKVQRYSFQRTFAEAYSMEQSRVNFYLGCKHQFEKLQTISVNGPKVIERITPYPTYEKEQNIPQVESGTFIVDQKKPVWSDRAIDNINNVYKGFKKSELDIKISDVVSKLRYKKTNNYADKIIRNEYVVYDTGRTLTGFISLNIEAYKNSKLYIIFDEVDYIEEENKNTDGINIVFSRNDTSNIIYYDLKAGYYNLLSIEPYSMRYIKIILIEGEISVKNLDFIKFENHEIYKMKFQSQDEDLNKIVEAAQHTLAQNSVDILMDCPSRERAGWLCDTWFSSRAEQLMTGQNKIEYNFLNNYVLAKQSPYLPEGMIPMNYPADHTDGIFIPNWSLWYGLELYDYYQRTGDQQLINDSKVNIYNLLKYFSRFENEFGLLEDLESWVFVEWSKANDFVDGINAPSNMIYAQFLESAGLLYDDITLIEKAKQVRRDIKKISFNGTFFEDNIIRDENNNLKSTGNITETCQYYAFFTHTATLDEHRDLYNLLMHDFGSQRNENENYPNIHKSNAFIGNYLRLEIMRRNKQYKEILKECKNYFVYMAKRTNTLWEHNQVFASLNHGFASYAAKFIIEALCGIVEFNQKTGEIKVIDPPLKIDFEAYLPFKEGIHIQRKNGKFKMIMPKSIFIEKL